MTAPHSPHGQAPWEDRQDDDASDLPPSKTRRKKDMHALQVLGEELIALPAHVVRDADLPENLRDAVLACQRISNFEGRRRQTQYVGKLMRQVDAAAVRAIVNAATMEDRASVARMHAIERWRDTLLADDKAATAFLDKFPQSDSQQLRQLVRGARAEAGTGKPPRNSRALYQLIKAAMQEAPGSPDAPPRLD